MIKQLTALSLLVATAAVSAETPTIDRLAPESSVLVIGVKDMSEMTARMKATRLWDLWQSDQMKALRADAMEEMTADLEAIMEELDVDRDALTMPTGAVGLAMYLSRDEEFGIVEPAQLLVADYGEAADGAGELMTSLLEKAEDELDGIVIETSEVEGATIHSLDLSAVEFGDGADAEPDPFAGGGMGMMPAPKDMMAPPDELHVARKGSTFILATRLDGVTHALEVMAEEAEPALPAREDFRALTDRLAPTDGFVYVLTRDAMSMMGANDPTGGMMMMMAPMLKSVVGDVKGFAMRFRVDGPRAMIEKDFFVSMPAGKAGLTKLMEVNRPREELPAFIGPDTVMYGVSHVELDKTMDVVRSVMASVPPFMMPPDAAEQVNAMEPTIRAITEAIGPELHSATMAARPFTAESMYELMAIRCRKPEQFEQTLAAIAPMLEPRDFLGSRIYTVPGDMMMGMMPGMPGGGGMGGAEELAIGIGAGFVFMGPPPSVERALRTTGQADLPKLSSEPAFQRAVGAMNGGEMNGWGFADVVAVIESTHVQTVQMREQMIQSIREQWDDEEVADEIIASIRAEAENDPLSKLDFDLLREYLGPSAWFMRSTDEGFVGSWLMMGAE